MNNKRKYRIVGIKEPGKVDVYPYGIICLHNLSDDRLEEILKNTNCPYIKPAIDAPEPKNAIKVSAITPRTNKQARQKE